MTYPSIEPYMKGIHLTAEAWRSNRDDEGWKIDEGDGRLLTLDEQTGEYILETDLDDRSMEECPTSLTLVPRLLLDVQAIRAILKGPTPVMRILRPRASVKVYYGFGDASGEGYGKALRPGHGRQRIKYEYGFWCSAVSEESSNYREFRNFLLWIR